MKATLLLIFSGATSAGSMLAFFARHGFIYLQHAGHRMPWWEAHCIDVAAGLILGAAAGIWGTWMLLRRLLNTRNSAKLKTA